jgi:hypothetical protein
MRDAIHKRSMHNALILQRKDLLRQKRHIQKEIKKEIKKIKETQNEYAQ